MTRVSNVVPGRTNIQRIVFAMTRDTVTALEPPRSSGRSRNLGTMAAQWSRIVRQDPCCYCGGVISETVDHVVALGNGGTSHWWNLTGACKRCNGDKGNELMLLFAMTRYREISRNRAKRHRYRRNRVHGAPEKTAPAYPPLFNTPRLLA